MKAKPVKLQKRKIFKYERRLVFKGITSPGFRNTKVDKEELTI